MSQAGPILFVSNAERPAFVAGLDEARLFPVVTSDWASASLGLQRSVANALCARATFRAAANDFDGFLKDILTVKRLARCRRGAARRGSCRSIEWP